MEIIGSILYGFVSGLAEIVPVSSQANQHLLRQLLGVQAKEPIRDMLIHIAVLVALIVSCRALFLRLRRDMVAASRIKRRSKSQIPKGVYELRVIRTAAPVLSIGLLISLLLPDLTQNKVLFSVLCLLNGIILMVPSHMHQGNKTARAMTSIDGFLFGFAGVLSIFPGISRVGSIVSMSILRKTDKITGFNWALMLSVPALIVWVLLDFIGIFTIGVGTITFTVFLGYLLSALFAFVGTYLAVTFMKIIVERTQLSVFSYYSFGVALLSFLLYLIT